MTSRLRAPWPFLDRRSEADLEALRPLQDQAMVFWSAGLGVVEPALPAPDVGVRSAGGVDQFFTCPELVPVTP